MVPQVPAAHAPGIADHALIALTALLPLAEAWWYWPRIVRALADRVPGTRRRAYRNLIILEWVLAVTAGLCEEFLYRGFALWYFTSLAGSVAGFVLAAVLFGLGHLYLGRMHVVRTAIVGAVFGLLVIGTGSLWVAIVLHAAMDL